MYEKMDEKTIAKYLTENKYFQKIPPERRQILISAWCDLYGAEKIFTEIKKANTWLIANPKRRYKNYARFLNNWLLRIQRQRMKKNINKNKSNPYKQIGIQI